MIEYGQQARMQPASANPVGTSAPLRAQLSLIADNIAIALDQVTRIEDAVQSLAQITGTGPTQQPPAPNTVEGLVNLLDGRVLLISNRLARIADRL